MYHPVMSVAHLLDPQYYGRKLSTNSTSIISQFIQDYYSSNADVVWQQLIEYRTQTGVFDFQLAWKTIDKVDPIAWWKGNFGISAPELCKVAVRVLSIPSSSAASEHNWSAFSYIHEKKRNRLINKRVFKLVYIYSNYKLKCPRQEFSDTMEAVIRFNNNPNLSYQKDSTELLDPIDNDNDSSENGETLINKNENMFESYSDFEAIDSKETDSEETETDSDDSDSDSED